MQIVKIKFSGMTGVFSSSNNFITKAMSKRFDIENSDKPDFLIYSVVSKDVYNYKCPRIFFTP